MFKDLRTSTKLFLLCAIFAGAIILATYSLIEEKQIAIRFVRKELAGTQYLNALRGVYTALLADASQGGDDKLRWMLYWRRFPKLKPKAAARSTRPRSLKNCNHRAQASQRGARS